MSSPDERAKAKQTEALLRELQAEAAEQSPAEGTTAENPDAGLVRELQVEAAGKASGLEATPPWYNRLGHAAKRAVRSVTGEPIAEEDYDAKMIDPAHGALGPLGYATAPSTFAVGVLDTLKNRDERTGSTAPVTTAVNSILDVISFGTLNKAEATMDQLYDEVPQNAGDDTAAMALSEQWKAETGEDFPTFAQRLDDVAVEQTKIREANPATALGSDLTAMVTTGGVLGKAAFRTANAMPAVLGKYLVGNTVRRVLFGSGVGAAETFAYSLNKNGDVERAVTDASLSMLGGTVLGGLGVVGVGKLYKHLMGEMAPDAIQASTGKILLDTINDDLAKKGMPELTAAQFAEQIAANGPNATALDIFPGLQKFANRIVSEGKDAARQFHDLIATRADFFRELKAENGTLRTAFQSPAILSEQSLMRNAAERKAALGPSFDAIYKANDAVRFSAKQIISNVQTLFGPKQGWSDDYIDAFDLLKSQLSAYTKQAKGDAINLRQANGLKEFLQSATGKEAVKVAGKDAAVASTNKAGRALTKAEKLVTRMIEDIVPDIAPLNALYGDLSSLRKAYKAGRKAFSSADIDKADIQAFLGDPAKSVLAKRAFVEGAKFHLFKTLNAAKSATAVEQILTSNQPLIESMEAMFGKEATTDMINSVLPMIKKIKTTEQLNIASLSGRGQPFLDTAGPELKQLMDASIVAGGPFGITSKAGSFGALGRLFGRPVNEAISDKADLFAGGIMSKMGEGASSAFSELQKLMQQNALQSTRGNVAATAGAAAATEAGRNLLE